MSESGVYKDHEISQCNKAYTLALECTFALARGSGKPFICHLVGTASILAAQGLKIEIVIAGLLHALFQNRVPFPNANSIKERFQILEERFGKDVADLVQEYTIFEDVSLTAISNSKNNFRFFDSVLSMRIADELEDITYFSLVMHGLPNDNIEVKGGHLWRKSQKESQIKYMLDFVKDFGLENLIDAINFWINAEPNTVWSEDLKTGKYSSFQIGQSIYSKTNESKL
jgi:hypothetical protein